MTETEYATAASIVPGTHTADDCVQALISALPGGTPETDDFHIEWQGSHDGGEHVTVFSDGNDDEGTDFVLRVEPYRN